MNRRIPWSALAVALLAGCGGKPAEGEAPSVPAPEPRPQVSVPAPAAEPDVGDPGGFSEDAKGAEVTAAGPDVPVLVDVRSAEHPGFDRVVFEFASEGLPQWRAEWVQIPITDCGAGQVVPVSGTAWLQVRFSGAAAHTPEGKATSGPRQRRLKHPVLRDLARTCDFEGEVTWVAGLAGKHAFRADTQSAPSRLVLDFAY
jgi:hypothetical protein